jgi:hypothetical protein
LGIWERDSVKEKWRLKRLDSFESLRSRSVAIDLGGRTAIVASLEDIIASKEAAARPKDQAQLPILRDTLRVKKALEKP